MLPLPSAFRPPVSRQANLTPPLTSVFAVVLAQVIAFPLASAASPVLMSVGVTAIAGGNVISHCMVAGALLAGASRKIATDETEPIAACDGSTRRLCPRTKLENTNRAIKPLTIG